MSSQNESRIGWLIYGGMAMIPIGGILLFMVFGGTTARLAKTGGTDSGPAFLLPMAAGVFVLGVVMAIVGLLYGTIRGKLEYAGTGARTQINGVKVITRYVYNKKGQMVNDEYLWEEGDDHRFYVKLQLPMGQIQEFECMQETFNNCGELMKGDAIVDGKWLGSFTAYIGRPDAT